MFTLLMIWIVVNVIAFIISLAFSADNENAFEQTIKNPRIKHLIIIIILPSILIIVAIYLLILLFTSNIQNNFSKFLNKPLKKK